MSLTQQDMVIAAFNASIEAKERSQEELPARVVEAAGALSRCLEDGGKILMCGNGGSASDAQHFSAELLNRFVMGRPALPGIALGGDAATLTSIANDFSFDQVFAKQIEAMARDSDVVVVISTSGNSSNILAAVEAAQAVPVPVIALTGRDGGKLAEALGAKDIEIRVPSDVTARIQEVHITVIHCLCELIDHTLFGYDPYEVQDEAEL